MKEPEVPELKSRKPDNERTAGEFGAKAKLKSPLKPDLKPEWKTKLKPELNCERNDERKA
jgi:hypothetical protein